MQVCLCPWSLHVYSSQPHELKLAAQTPEESVVVIADAFGPVPQRMRSLLATSTQSKLASGELG